MSVQRYLYCINVLLICFGACQGIREFLSFDDLVGLGTNPDIVRLMFKISFGDVEPDGISLNYEDKFAGIGITGKYGIFCYKSLGTTVFTFEDTSALVINAAIGNRTVYNQGRTPKTMVFSVTGKSDESTGYTSSITSGMSFNTEFDVEGIFKGGPSFNLSVSAGRSKTKNFSRLLTKQVTIQVPPRSKKKVYLVAQMKTLKLHFRTPIYVEGQFGANFPHRVNGHYFWYLDARKVLPRTSGEITGTIFVTRVVDTLTTAIEPVEPFLD